MSNRPQRYFSKTRLTSGSTGVCRACGAKMACGAAYCGECGVSAVDGARLAKPGDPAATKVEFDTFGRGELVPVLSGRRKPGNVEAARLLIGAHILSGQGADARALRCQDEISVTPLDYQSEAAVLALFDLHGRAVLADEVGLGKTIEAGLCIRELMERRQAGAVLILVPSSLREQWKGELAEKFGIEAADHESPGLGKAPLVLLSLTRAKLSPLSSRLKRRRWDLVVVDEAHGLKNSRTVAHRFVRSLKTLRMLLLTATPVENELRELYNLMVLVDPTLYPTYRKFAQEFLKSRYEVRDVAALRQFCGKFMIRRRRAAVVPEMPSREVEVVPYQMQQKESGFYRSVIKYVRSLHKLTGGAKEEQSYRGLALFTTLLLKESCSSPEAVISTLNQSEFLQVLGSGGAGLSGLLAEGKRVGRTAKMEAFGRTVAGLDEAAVAYVEFFATHQRLVQELEGRGVAVIPYTGQMGAAAKVAALDRFRQEGGVLLCTEVGGQGLNLQNCRTVVNYDIPWNPMRLEQRVGRVHRYGQKFTTRIVHFVSPGTFEAHIFDVLTRKLGLFRQVIGEVEAILSFLEEDEGLQQMLTHAVCLSADDADMERRFEELRLRVDLARSRYERSVQTTVALLDGEV